MGGDLPEAGDGAAPTFLAFAARDPADGAGLLQQLQLVKGWIDADGAGRTQVIPIAGSPDNGASVDPATGERSGEGHDSLCTVYRDEDFDPRPVRLLLSAVVGREPQPALELARLRAPRPGRPPGRVLGRLLSRDDPGDGPGRRRSGTGRSRGRRGRATAHRASVPELGARAFWPASGAKRRSAGRAGPAFLAAALLAGCVDNGGSPAPAAGQEPTLGESLVARGEEHELDTVREPTPGDFIEHEAAGFAKVLCSAVFLTGLDFRGRLDADRRVHFAAPVPGPASGPGA